MDRYNASRQLLTVIGRLAACAVSLTFIYTLPAQADQFGQDQTIQAGPIDQPGDFASRQSDLANTFVTQMHADPLVASCAAHGNFIASTSDALDHVEFPPSSFDSAHSTVTPWNDSFDEGKQRVKVDTIVTVDGIGIPKDSSHGPYDLKFRCGYIGQQILAFSWNDPVPPLRARSESRASAGGTAAHASGKHSAKSKKTTSKSKKAATSSKSGHKSQATSTKSTKSTKSATSSKSTTKSTSTSTARKTGTKKKSTTQ
ncbi:Lipoprotein transmembrane [Paraburkholderia sacchari]|uniref:BspC domain-containing protein n=1 Tax=Paraburkholderia sacchari TaxID=159450 RepID=UPI0039A5CA7A